MTHTKSNAVTAAILFASLATSTPARADVPATQPARHVVLIGLDGARPDAIRDHAGPALRSLLQNATVCWNAKAVRPSITEVNWPSILTGASPAHHGIDHHYLTQQELAPISLKVPTLFQILAQNHLTTAAFLGHWKLFTLQNSLPNCYFDTTSTGSHNVSLAAADYIRKHTPDFAFIYFGDLDGLGHTYGWMSPQYLAGIPKIDAALQNILGALRDAHIADDTDILLTSDHGGSGKQHALGTPEDTHIPWLAAGPDFPHPLQLTEELSTLTTAPTILTLLHIQPPPSCDSPAFTATARPSTLPAITKYSQ